MSACIGFSMYLISAATKFLKGVPRFTRFTESSRHNGPFLNKQRLIYIAKTLMMAMASSSANPWFIAAAIRFAFDNVAGIKAFIS